MRLGVIGYGAVAQTLIERLDTVPVSETVILVRSGGNLAGAPGCLCRLTAGGSVLDPGGAAAAATGAVALLEERAVVVGTSGAALVTATTAATGGGSAARSDRGT